MTIVSLSPAAADPVVPRRAGAHFDARRGQPSPAAPVPTRSGGRSDSAGSAGSQASRGGGLRQSQSTASLPPLRSASSGHIMASADGVERTAEPAHAARPSLPSAPVRPSVPDAILLPAAKGSLVRMPQEPTLSHLLAQSYVAANRPLPPRAAPGSRSTPTLPRAVPRRPRYE